jgi:putative Mg2+ transporter-C (MgtC) family protein
MWAATSFELDMDVVLRLLGATVLGGAVGVEREASDQPAGLRTHIAVAVGAALFGIVSTLGFLEVDQLRANSTIQADVSRVASNVVVGIGFLGAGVIFRQGSHVRNLTTAASLWTVAAIGLACGVGDVTTAAIATVVLLGGLVLLKPIRNFISHRWATGTTTVRVELAPGVEPAALIRHLPSDDTVEAEQFTVLKEDGHLVLVSELSGPPAELRAWVSQLAGSAEVQSVALQ